MIVHAKCANWKKYISREYKFKKYVYSILCSIYVDIYLYSRCSTPMSGSQITRKIIVMDTTKKINVFVRSSQNVDKE